MSTDNFSHAALMPLANQRHTRQDLANLARELTTNAIAIPSNWRASLRNRYALASADYLSEIAVAFIPPTNPGSNPSTLLEQPACKKRKVIGNTLLISLSFILTPPPNCFSNDKLFAITTRVLMLQKTRSISCQRVHQTTGEQVLKWTANKIQWW
jgi:hypothetical protein